MSFIDRKSALIIASTDKDIQGYYKAYSKNKSSARKSYLKKDYYGNKIVRLEKDGDYWEFHKYGSSGLTLFARGEGSQWGKIPRKEL